MKNLKILSIILLLLFLQACSRKEPDGIFQIKLKTIEGQSFELKNLEKNKASILVFLLPDCPACESYSATLKNLKEKYADANIEFYGVFPGTFNSVDEMMNYKNLYKINFPLLQDPENILVHSLGATIVPSVFLLNDQSQVLYKGRIDDWLYSLGKKKESITKHDLDDAIQAVTADQAVIVKETQAIGCILE